MILGIEVLCEGCGTELEIPDVTTDHLLRVTLKARPCPKCNRPPDCQLSCEDVLELKKKLKNLQEHDCFGMHTSKDTLCLNCAVKEDCKVETNHR